nr:YTH domain-containing protein 1-like isoform X2 [Misgurnus anguillicaudatus]
MDMTCCKSVGTELSMLDIDDFITEISLLKKEVALLETKLRSRGDEGVKREDVVCCESSVYVTDESLDSVWVSSRDQTPQPPLLDKHTQDSELSLTLLCYTESKPTETQDTTVCDSNRGLEDDQTSTESLDSVCNAGEQQQILQTTLKMCSVKLIDCRNLMLKTEPIAGEHHTEEDEEPIAEEHHTEEDEEPIAEEHHTEEDEEPIAEEHHTEEDEDYDDDGDDDFIPSAEEHDTEEDEDYDGDDFIPSDKKTDSCSDEEIMSSTSSKERLPAQTLSSVTDEKTFRHLERCDRKHTEQKFFTCTKCLCIQHLAH